MTESGYKSNTISNSISSQKKDIRKIILRKRKEMPDHDVRAYSEQVCKHIMDYPVYQASKNICLYMPVHNEVDTTFLIEPALDHGKNIWLPRVFDGRMDFFAYDRDTGLIQGAYNIMEPDSLVMLEEDNNTLIVMPGAVFSETHDRIGYGGGYYDRYLTEHPECKTLAVCYEFQIQKEIPVEEHDMKPDAIMTEQRLL